MLDRQKGNIVFQCDGCNEVLETNQNTRQEMREANIGADNQAERVIARMEFREHLARLYHDELCKHVKLLKISWDDLSDEHKAAVLHGITAVLDEISRRENNGRIRWAT